jgi:arginase family enzyme
VWFLGLQGDPFSSHPGLVAHISADLREKAVLFPTVSLDSGKDTVSQILREIATDSVYISIDKDVLDPTHAVTNWDQGSMKLPDLLHILTPIIQSKKVYGVDICGELPVSTIELFQPSALAAIRKNEIANRKILRVLKLKTVQAYSNLKN